MLELKNFISEYYTNCHIKMEKLVLASFKFISCYKCAVNFQ